MVAQFGAQLCLGILRAICYDCEEDCHLTAVTVACGRITPSVQHHGKGLKSDSK